MYTATTLKNPDLIDFQKFSTRNDHVISIMEACNDEKMGFVAFFSLLRREKARLNACLEESLHEYYQEKHLRLLLSKIFELYFFKRFILKTQAYDGFLEVSNIPSDLLNDLQKKYGKNTFENGISYIDVEVAKGSPFDVWIRSAYLSLVSQIFRGVFGYKATIRYVFTQPGMKQEWDERFFNKHANFHWDQDLNSFTMIMYLSDVGSSDGPFKIIEDSKFYTQNLYLSIYNRFITDTIALDTMYPCGDRVGSYIDDLPRDKEFHFVAPAGTVIQFYGRHIMHDGGFPEVGRSRIALFIDQRNFLMKPLRLVSRLLAYFV